MDGWKQYVFSLIVCSLTCGIVVQFVSDTKRKALIHLITGTVLAIAILDPISRMNPKDYRIPVQIQNDTEYYIAEGEKIASEIKAQCIKTSCEEYILNKANALGAEITAKVSLDEALNPLFVEIGSENALTIQNELQTILTTDLGIPKENQKWIWNQENNSSYLP